MEELFSNLQDKVFILSLIAVSSVIVSWLIVGKWLKSRGINFHKRELIIRVSCLILMLGGFYFYVNNYK